MPTIRERNGKFQVIVRKKVVDGPAYFESKTFPTRAQAESWGLRLEREIGIIGPEKRQKQRTKLSDLLRQYVNLRANVKPLGRSTLYDIDMLDRSIGNRNLDELDAKFWTKFAEIRRARGAGPATVMHNMSVARAVLNAATPLLGIEASAKGIEQAIKRLNAIGAIGTAHKRERRVSDAELDLLAADFRRLAAHPQTILPMETFIRLGVALPRRLGELCNMKWANYGSGILTLEDTKHPRYPRDEKIPVPPQAAAILDTIPRFDARILPYKPESVSASFERAVKRLGLDDLRFHDLRHEGICRLFEMGLDIPEVSLISGHLSWTTLRRYTHLKPERVLEKLNAGA